MTIWPLLPILTKTSHVKFYTSDMKQFVYILECRDKSLYVGCTNDLKKRLHEHNHLKQGAHYTKIRRPVVLRYVETVDSFGAARKREGEIKAWPRKKKLGLIGKGI